MQISTSILSIKENLVDNLLQLNKTNTDYIHLDIMDGKFVSNKTDFNKDIIQILKKPLDIHLMVNDVFNYINEYFSYNPEFITFHIEIEQDKQKIINYLKTKNIKVGLSLNPETKVDKLLPYLEYIDLVLVMSVEPGKGGQQFIDITNKIKTLDELRKNNNYKYEIEVDGGINDINIELLKETNADIAVVGSFITNTNNYEHQINFLKSI